MKISKEAFDKLQKLRHSYINELGQEVLNPIPKELAAGLERPPTLQQRVQRAIAQELSRQAELQAYETIQDAQDFDLEDDFVVQLSGYELDRIPVAPPDPEVPPPSKNNTDTADDPPAGPPDDPPSE